MSNSVDLRLERKQASLLYDTRRLGERVQDLLAAEEAVVVAMTAFAVVLFFGRQLTEFVFLAAVCFFFYTRGVQKRAGLALRMPKSSREVDPKELDFDRRPDKAAGIIFMGNEQKTGEEVWLTDSMARTHMMFMGTTGSGKAQPLDAKVLTPSGWKRMGDLQVGDTVSTPDGGSASITGVFPQGELPIYRITFADGRSTEACGDHLWEVHHKHWNGKYRPGVSRAGAARPRILSTNDVIALMRRNSGSFSVRLAKPAMMERQGLPLDPYLLGALLGDGGLSGGIARFTSDDEHVLEAVAAACPKSVELHNYPAYQHPRDHVLAGPRGRTPGGDYAHNPVRVELDRLGLAGVRSEDKFVPDVYKNASVEQRRLLLQGLMDTDGYGGLSVGFTSVSRRLAEDVQYLVRSLGGIAQISTKTPTYTYNGDKKVGKLAYTVKIRHPEPSSLFTLPRKRERRQAYQYAESLKLGIKSIEPVGSKLAQCIMVDHPEHLYVTDDFVVTHNTEYLISLVYNALIHGSGLIYVDGKADSSLYGKVYSMARSMGREDDVLVINFQTGAKDIYGAQPNKLSNTLNPFAVGSSGMLSELVKGLMATGEKSTWTQQAESFVEALLKPLVYLRDNHGLNLDVNVVRDYFELNKLEDLAWKDGDKYPGLVESGALDGLHAYLLNKPGYKKEKFHDQSETTHEQHGYITMQLGRTFNSLSDTYGYIMKTPLAEIDFVDVFLNRRILVVLLPALEKSPSELTNLGRIVVASIKATMAKGLGSQIEGDWKKVIASKPTTSPSPFMCVLDEYGYYAVEGFAVVPAQARSLGFSAIFAGQDLPAFQKASKEEAASTLANTNTKLCGKLECMETFQYFKNMGGQGIFTSIKNYETDPGGLTPANHKASTTVNVEQLERVNLEALRGQISGEWHLFYGNTLLRVKSFFANPKPVKNLRVNHFLKVARPDPEEVDSFRKSSDMFTRAVNSDGGLQSFMDVAGSVADINDIQQAFGMLKSESALLTAGMVLAHCADAEQRRVGAFAKLTAAHFETEEEDLAAIDFAAQMVGGIDAEPASELAGSAWGSAHARAPWEGPSERSSREALASDRSDTGSRPLFDDAPLADPEGLFDGIPADVVVRPGGEVAVDFGLDNDASDGTGTDAEGDHWSDGYDLSQAAAEPERATFVKQPIEFADHTSLFGVDGDDVPEEIFNAVNDVSVDASDRPQDPKLFADDADVFDEPAADQGLLDREATASGLAEIERLTGASEEEARVTAAIVTEDLGDATRYPMSAPTKKPGIGDLINLGDRINDLLGSVDQED